MEGATRDTRNSPPLDDATVSYGRSDGAWTAFDALLRETIRDKHLKSVCEVGGGANPTLPMEFLKANDVDYTIVDISRDELSKAPAGYRTVVADVCDNTAWEDTGMFHLVFSKMLAEHIADPQAFHRNIWSRLVSGGIALHFFPTMYALPFVVNRLIPEIASARLLSLVAPRDQRMHRKFPAFYRWCRGPTRRQVARFARLQYRVLEYRGFFGHGYYDRVPLLKRALNRVAGFLVRHPLPDLTSYSWVMLQKAA